MVKKSSRQRRRADPGLAAAIAVFAGSETLLAQALGLTQPAISAWKRRHTWGRQIPAEYVPRLTQMTGLPGRTLRPDLYGEPEPEPEQAPA